MSRRLPAVLLAASASALVAGACTATTRAPGEQAPSAAGAHTAAPREDPRTVVARVNGEDITLGDLDKPLRGKLRAMDREHLEQRHKLREQSLDAMVVQRLVEAEAKKQGKTEEQILKAEIEARTAAPTDEELKAFYDENAARMPGAFDDVKDQLRQFMHQDKQRKALMAYFDALKATAKVELLLPEPELPPVEVAAVGPAKGAEGAPVTIVEFSDFQCPFCGRVNPVIAQVLAQYAGKVRVVFRDYPLPFHEKAPKAAEAGQCADEQGKFWEMHDRLFAHQSTLDVSDLKQHARAIGLDGGKFDDCLDSGRMADRVKKSMDAGEEAGVDGTPAFFINGRQISGAQPFEEFKKLIDKELARVGAPAPGSAGN